MQRLTAKSQWALLTLLVVSACNNDPALGPDDPETSTLSGIVTNRATLGPVAGAVVEIGDASMTTGVDGRYEFAGLTPGTATLRCTALSFVETSSEITLASGTVHVDISLERIEVYDLGDFALQISPAVDVPRGILIALGGPNTKGFATGEPFGAPVAEVEAALQALGLQFKGLAATRQMAILGTSLAQMAEGPESDQLILDVLQAAEEASGRPGLAALPILMYGMSGGAPQASGFTARHQERVAGAFFKVPLGVSTSAEVAGIPTLMLMAELDAFVDNAALTAAFQTNRAAEGLWAMVMESDVPHHSLSSAQRQLTLAWMGHVLDARLPDNPAAPLNHLVESAGWLGNPATGAISSWLAYPGDRASASWLPSHDAAEAWGNFVAAQLPPVPAVYPDLSGVYQLTGVVTSSDGWGLEGEQQASTLSIQHSTTGANFQGTFESIAWTSIDGTVHETPPGAISGTVDVGGQVRFDLLIDGNSYPSRFEGTLASDRIEGMFWAGSTSGPFVAERRGS